MKKVFLITTVHSVWDQPISRAFETLGWAVTTIDYRGNSILMPGKFIHRAIAKLPSRVKYPVLNLAQWQIDLKIIAAAKACQPDLILVLKGKDLHPSTLKQLRGMATLANYYPETFDHWERIKSISRSYDHFFNYDSEVVKKLKETGYSSVHYLPFCADLGPEVEFPDFNKKKYAVSFIGSFMPVRYAQRETILDQIKDLGLHVWGNKAWLKTSLKDYYYGWLSTEEMLGTYRQSKIVVNIDLMRGVDGTGVNLRPFEVTSCGALLLNHDDRKDIFNLFKDREEFVSFQGPEDVRLKVEYYLNHETELEAIARAGFDRAKNDHTYLKRMQMILDITKV